MKQEKKKNRKKSPILVFAIILMLASGATLVYFSYDYFVYWQNGRAAQGQTDVVRDMFQGQMDDINQLVLALPMTNGGEVQSEIMTIAFDTSPLDNARELTNNPDIIGFLFVEGTNITNVILQGNDNYFYLERDMFGNHNVNGSVFMDFRNTPDFTDQNTILYGHNMNNGTMFHDVRYYMDKEFFEAHPHIKVVTENKVFVYEIFSTFSTRVDNAYRMDFDYIQVLFDNNDEFGNLVDEMMRRSAYDTGITANQDDRILVLSTCTNVQRDTRYVVAARLAQTFIIES